MNPKISIVVPVFNTKKYLEKCINSVLSQTLKEIEVIIVDDGSTDGSAEICDLFAKHENVKVIHKINEGVSIARNVGMEYAHGEYIGFVDSDDYIDACMYEELYKEVERHPGIDIVSCGCNLVSEDGKKLGTWFPDVEKNNILERNDIKQVLARCNTSKILWFTWKSIFSRKLIYQNTLRYFTGKIIEDPIFNLQALMHAQKIMYLDKCLYNYVQTTNSAQRTKYRVSLLQQLENLFFQKRTIMKEYLANGFEEDLFEYTYRHTIPMLLANEIGGNKNVKLRLTRLREIRQSEMICETLKNVRGIHIHSLRLRLRLWLFKNHLFCFLMIV